MASESLLEFCGSPFWDENIAWNTTNPDIPECFQKSALVWISCGFLWLFTPLEVYFLHSSKGKTSPWTGLSITKIIICLILAALSLLDMTYWLTENSVMSNVPYANFNSPFIRSITYILSAILLTAATCHGRRSSSILFVFWLLVTITHIISYRTQMLLAFDSVSVVNFMDFFFQTTSFPFVVCALVLSTFLDSTQPIRKGQKEQNACPELVAPFLSQLIFAWFDKMAFLGYKRPLVLSDLWELAPNNTCAQVMTSFSKNWERKPKQRSSSTHQDEDLLKQRSILGALWTTFRWPFIFAGLLRLTADVLAFAGPLVLQELIAFISNGDEPVWKGYFYAVLIFAAAFLQSVIYGQQYLIMFNISMRVRSAVVSAIYNKALRINSSVKRTSTAGEIVNLMSVDAQRLMDLLPELHVAWSALVQIAVALYMLWGLLGPSTMAGLGTMLLMIPVNGLIAGKFKTFQIEQMKNKDDRVRIMNEILNGMKVLKLYAWEQSFCEQVNDVRAKELNVMKRGAYLNALASFVFNTVPVMVTLSTFATYVLIDDANSLDATKAFVSLSLFNIIRLPLFFVPMLFISMLQAAVSFQRMDKFLNSEELDFDCIQHDNKNDYPISIKDATFSWGPSEPPSVTDINLQIEAGTLVAIVGPVGSGKSSLLAALLGDMNKRSGYVNTKGSMAYVPQQAWMQHATLKENILFGKNFNERLYKKVLEACALGPDLEILQAGDQTEIGEKGINLSGGQKQRVSLARAVYTDADVYILDDPLSAVDSHVGKHIFENVIGPTGLLLQKTRIFVTNGVTYLPRVDTIVVLSDGRISEVGSYEELLAKKGAFAYFLMTYLKEQQVQDLTDDDLTDLEEIAQDLLTHIGTAEDKRRMSRQFSQKGTLSSDEENPSDDIVSYLKRRKISRVASIDSPSVGTSSRRFSRKESSVVAAPTAEVPPKNQIIQAESMETGKVEWLVYLQYLRALGFWMVIFTAVQYLVSMVFSVGSNIWLAIWSNDQPTQELQDTSLRDLRLGVYGGLGIGQALMVLGASYALAIGCINSSRFLHSSMLENILRCPMVFFDTTPLGRIVNRFSKDIDVIDTTIPTILRPLIGTFLQVFGTLVVICISTPIFLAVVPPIGIAYYLIQRFYISTSRQLKRIESVTRSPIFSHFSETLSGSSTIRAYGRVDDFIRESEERVDLNQACYYPSIIATRWLSVRLELTASIMVFCATIFAVLSRDTIDPGMVGLSISYASSVTSALTFMVRMTCELETNIVAIERIKEYAMEAQEAEWTIPEKKPNPSWPALGTIKFQNYSMRYRTGLDPVLRAITCGIRQGEKIGIVGRTGAGKSSLTLALFRIIEPAGGTILIDDIDITKIGLHDLRSKLTIIPQDPVLFSGTLRMNLDPFSFYNDDAVWKAIEQSHLKTFVSSLPDGLYYPVAEGGENLSVGQRQLVCLARALLRKTKLLILDEATAAVDLETDDLIQATIRKEFANCTVLTIAHRLNTILDSTRVLVLSDGVIVEFDSPTSLLQDKKSQFYSMAKDAMLVPA